MKNTLAENMLRFGVKNLQETEIEKLKEQAAVATKEFNEAEPFIQAAQRGEIKIGVSRPENGFNTTDGPGYATFFRDPIVLWDGQVGLVYAKRHHTMISDKIPDPNTPAGKKWHSEHETKINASAPIITEVVLVGDRVQSRVKNPGEEIKPFEYTILKFCAAMMKPAGFQNGAGKAFVELTNGGIKPNLQNYTKASLINDINAGKFGPNAKGKVEALVSGFKLV